jgi:hypothetical protein
MEGIAACGFTNEGTFPVGILSEERPFVREAASGGSKCGALTD